MIGELPWLEPAWERAAAGLSSGRFPQGLLVIGKPGLGRRRLARAIAAARLCEKPGADGRPCGACRSCRQVAAGAHADLIEVDVPEDKTQILVDQIRELSRALSLASGSRGLRSAIVHSAERMNRAAANALLKTLEEAPQGVSIIMVTERLSALPVTIASRCLQLAVEVPEEAAALDWLNAREARSDWPLFLSLAGGAPLVAEQLAADWDGSPADDLRRLCEAAAGRTDPVGLAAALKGLPLERLAGLVAWLAQGALRQHFGGARSAGTDLSKLAAGADPRALHRAWQEARGLAVNATSLNADLARERLVLLFVDALHPPASRRS